MPTVLVTGASGYIGKHVTLQLVRAGYRVRASVRSEAKAQEVQQVLRQHLPSDHPHEDVTFVMLDLTSDEGWDQALDGVDALLHTASPFTLDAPVGSDVLVRPAVDGTLRALRAAHRAGVSRVILTSSLVAIWGSSEAEGPTGWTESMWTDLDSPLGRDAYNRSKTLAERAAWDYVEREAPAMRLTTINPGAVLGAPLDEHFGTSVALIERVLAARDPAVPDLRLPVVDVRDVARMHVDALARPASEGRRFIACAETISFYDIARLVADAYRDRRIVTRRVPSLFVRLLAIFDPSLRSALPLLGRSLRCDTSHTREVFDFAFIPAPVSVRETADFLVQRGY